MDIVERLRKGCTCNFESTPCGAEEECRNAFDGANEIEQLQATIILILDACEDVNSPDRKVRIEIRNRCREALKEKS
jgi:hypothetical protein